MQCRSGEDCPERRTQVSKLSHTLYGLHPSHLRHAAVDVLEVVVGVGDVEFALVFVGVAVAVASEGCLVVIVEEGVAE